MLLIGLELEHSLHEIGKPEENLFEDIEQMESPTDDETWEEEEKGDPVELEKDSYGIWPGVVLLIAIKLVMIIWF